MADNKPIKKAATAAKKQPELKAPPQPNKRAMFGDSTARVFTRNIRSA